jgi:SAM-dependent methyltransferase
MIGPAGSDHHDLHSPQETGRATAMVNAYVTDIDSHYRRAASEGADIVTPLEDMFWGDRRYEALDLEGHRWHFAERVKDVLPPPAPAASRPRTVPHSAGMFDDSYLQPTPPPWDIGRPQPAFRELAESGGLVGRVLDVGCGTGEHALLAASLGHQTFGVDIAAHAINLAEEKAAARRLQATFVVLDALHLADLNIQFDTVLDCGLFHGFGDAERVQFIASLAAVLTSGATYHLLCFSDQEPGDWGPRRITRGEIRTSFQDGWSVESIDATRLELTIDPSEVSAWYARIKRL